MHRAWQDRAANDDGVARTLALESLADLFTNPSDVSQVKIAVDLAGCADANEGQLRLLDRLDWIAGGAQPAGLGSGCDDLTDFSFNDGRLAAVDEVDLGRDRVDTNDLVSIMRETPRRNRPHIPQPEDANSHTVLSARITPPSANSRGVCLPRTPILLGAVDHSPATGGTDLPYVRSRKNTTTLFCTISGLSRDGGASRGKGRRIPSTERRRFGRCSCSIYLFRAGKSEHGAEK